jgi:hypothetical protein
VEAPDEIADRLENRWVRRTRQMFASDWPVQLAMSYAPLAVAGSQDIALSDTGPTGLHKRLAARGDPVARLGSSIRRRAGSAWNQLVRSLEISALTYYAAKKREENPPARDARDGN